jgi:signal transduction histidine kinase
MLARPMRRRMEGLGPRMTLASAAVALVAALIFGALLLSIQSQRDAASGGRDARRTIDDANAIKLDVLNAETGLRGYLIARSDSFLAPYELARRMIPSDVAVLLHEVADDPPGTQRAAQAIADHTEAYLTGYAAPLVARVRTHHAATVTMDDLVRGRAMVDALRRLVDPFIAVQQGILDQKRTSSDSAVHRAVAIAVIGLVVVALLMVLMRTYLLRAVLRPVRRVAHAVDVIAGGDLGARVPRRGGGEVGRLAGAFNAMVASLQDSQGRTARQTAELEAQRGELVAAVERLGTEKARVERYLRFGRRVNSEVEVEAVAHSIVSELADLSGAERAALYGIESERDEPARRLAEVGPGEAPLTVASDSPMAQSLYEGRLVRGHRPVLVDAGGDELHVPLRSGESSVGVIVLARALGERFDAEAVETVADLAVQAGVTLAKAMSLRSAREAASLVRAVLDATPDAIAVTDPGGVTVLENPPMGVVRAALVESARAPGGGFRTDVHADTEDPEQEIRDELELLGSRRVFARYIGPVRGSSGMLIGRLVVLREITAQREAERVKDEFFALVSHELRTPLTAIIGYVELVLDDDEEALDISHRRHLEIVQRNARRLLRLVGDLLFVAQVEAGHLALELGRVDLADIAAQSVQTFRRRADGRSISLHADLQPVPEVAGDRDRLGQAIDNLIANALKFTPEGGSVEVRVRANDGHVLVEVADTGPGVPAEEQTHVFERFFRAEHAVVGAFEGIGLGLAIVRAIADGHSGEIDVRSEPGAGATFTLTLPVAARERAAARAQAAGPPGGAGGR